MLASFRRVCQAGAYAPWDNRPVAPFNLMSGELEHSSTRDGFRWRGAWVGELLEAERIGASLYELGDGQLLCPYHFHHGVEEWLYVVAGQPVVRTPDGERTLRPGDVMCFPAGAAGAHATRGPGRILMISANRDPSIAVYPDSDKLGSRPGGDTDRLNFRRSDAVDYWDGE
jgi:uncharacterized cupin superfamily protein